MAAKAALGLVNTEVELDYWLPVDPHQELQHMQEGVTRQPVVQPHLQVHHGQGRLGRHGVKEVQRVQHELAERHGDDWIGLVITQYI